MRRRPEQRRGRSGRPHTRRAYLGGEQGLDLLKVGDDAVVDDDKLVLLVARLRVAVHLGGRRAKRGRSRGREREGQRRLEQSEGARLLAKRAVV